MFSRLPAMITMLCLSAPAQQQQPSAWRLTQQTTHNQAIRLLTTTSADTFPSADGTLKRASLQLKCTGPLAASATISADSPDTFAVKSDSTVTLPIRLDGEPAIHASWANLSLHQILIYDLRDLLPAHRRMTIALPLGPGPLQTLTFDLSQLASTMRESNCRRRIQ